MTTGTYRYRRISAYVAVGFIGAMVVLIAGFGALSDQEATVVRILAAAVAVFGAVGTVLLLWRLGTQCVVVEDGVIRLVGFGRERRCLLADVRLLSVSVYVHQQRPHPSVVLWLPRSETGWSFSSFFVGRGLDDQSREALRRVEQAEGVTLGPFVVPLSRLDDEGARAVVAAVSPLDSTGELRRRIGSDLAG